jgi:hypothetical protein
MFKINNKKLLKKLGEDYVETLRYFLRKSGKEATGKLYKTLDTRVKKQNSQLKIFIESEKYLKYVDQGRKKGTYAPVKAISDWVRVKNITFPNAVYLINRKIFKEGIKPTNVIRDTTKLWRVNQTFKREYEEIMAKDMEEILSFSMDELASDKPTKSRLGKIFETIKNYFS